MPNSNPWGKKSFKIMVLVNCIYLFLFLKWDIYIKKKINYCVFNPTSKSSDNCGATCAMRTCKFGPLVLAPSVPINHFSQ